MSRVRFIIIGRARSGTTLLHKVLGNHSEISMCDEEISPVHFFKKGIGVYTRAGVASLNDDQKKDFHKSLFDLITSSIDGANDAKDVRGIKTAIGSVWEAKASMDYFKLNRDRFKVIYLQRENLLAQHVSFTIAKKFGRWHTFNKSHVKIEKKVSINKGSLLDYIHECKQIDSFLDEIGEYQKVLKLSYERDIELNLEQTLLRVQDFLGLKKEELSQFVFSKNEPIDQDRIQGYNSLKNYYSELKEMRLPELSQKWNKHFYVRNKYRNVIKSIIHRIKHK